MFLLCRVLAVLKSSFLKQESRSRHSDRNVSFHAIVKLGPFLRDMK
jgi:hypothetical protein